MPQTCPRCAREGVVILDEDEISDEGVDMDSSDWVLESLGLSGTAYCSSCGAWFSWGLDGEEVIGSVRRAEPESPMDTSV
jgi:hypothetical protein